MRIPVRYAARLLVAGMLGWATPAAAQTLPWEVPATPTPSASPSGSPSPTPTPSDVPPEFKEHSRYVPPFFIVDHDEARHTDFHMLMMLYWSDNNLERSYHLLIPLFYRRTNHQTRGTTTAGPLFYFYSSPTSKAGYIPPFYWEHGPEVRRFGLPPLFWYGRTGPKDKAEVTSYVFPLYFYDDREGHTIFATPLGGGWGPKNDRQGLVGLYYWRNTHLHDGAPADYVDFDEQVLFPLFWHVRDGDTNSFVAGPLFWQAQTRSDGGKNRSFGLFPLFYERKSAGGGKTVVTPLSVFERTDARNSWLITPLGGFARHPDSKATVVGPFISASDPTGNFWSVLPLLYHYSGATDDGTGFRSWTIAALYFEDHLEYQVDPGSGDYTKVRRLRRGLFPLFYYSHEGDHTAFTSPVAIFVKKGEQFRGLFLPFYYSQSTHHKTAFLLPGFWYHEGTHTAYSFGFLPFYWVQRPPEQYVERGVSTTVAGPTHIGLIPFFFYSNRINLSDGKRDRVLTLLPLFWFSESGGSQTFLSPLAVQIRRPASTRTMVAWLWWDHQAEHYRNLTLLPLFNWERDGGNRRLVTPVGGYAKDADVFRALWGPYYRYTEAAAQVSNTVVFPLYWDLREGQQRTWVVPPYYQVKEGSYFSEGIVPFWFHSSFPGSATTVVFPLFLAQHDKIARTHALYTPLFGLWTTEDPYSYRFLAPLLFHSSGPDSNATVVFPLYWQWRNEGKRTWIVPPVYVHTDADGKSKALSVFPLFYARKAPQSGVFASLPFIYWRDQEDRNTIIPPLLYWWERDPENSSGLAGPWYWNKSLKHGDRNFTRVLFPLFYEHGRDDRDFMLTPLGLRVASANTTAYGFLPGFGWSTRSDPDTQKVVRWSMVAGPFYYRSAPGAGDAVLFPLLFHTHDEQHAETLLLPFCDWGRRGTATHFFTPLGGGGNDPVEHHSWWWALTAFHDQDRDVNQTAVLPLFYARSSPRAHTTLTPLFYHHSDDTLHESTTFAPAFLPLFFRTTAPDREAWWVLPFAYSSLDKTTGVGRGGVIPFAFWEKSPEHSWTLLPFLLTFYERRGTDHLGIYGPYVDVQIQDRRTLGVFPLFRYHREPDYRSFLSLPFIWWLERDGYSRAFVGLGYWNNETGTRIFPGYFRWQELGDKHEVEKSVEIGLPLFVRYRTPHKDTMVIAPWYRVKRDDGSKLVGVAPFWFASSKPGEHSWSVLGDLIGYEEVGNYSRVAYLWIFHTHIKPVKKKKPDPAVHAVLEPAHERGC